MKTIQNKKIKTAALARELKSKVAIAPLVACPSKLEQVKAYQILLKLQM